jgi:hypothetical protein
LLFDHTEIIISFYQSRILYFSASYHHSSTFCGRGWLWPSSRRSASYLHPNLTPQNLTSILILSSYVQPNFLLSEFLTKSMPMYAFFFSPIRVTFHANFTLLDRKTLVIFWEFRSWCSWICIFFPVFCYSFLLVETSSFTRCSRTPWACVFS